MNMHLVSKTRVLLDFDGTVTTRDSVDAVLEKFALPEWQDVEREWEQGQIGSRECLQRQTALIRATPEAMDAFVDTIKVDPAFADLLGLCRRSGAQIEIVSDGFERSVRRVLARIGQDCTIKANLLVPVGQDRWTVLSPYAEEDCCSGAGTCKCRAAGAGHSILIGDGRSDFCVAKEASFVFAKGRLADYCRDQGIAHRRIASLSDALQPLAQRLSVSIAA
jgi:2-hydroxy-3-keto-5-methylthiopentenyl-1-phosphate phosphatase